MNAYVSARKSAKIFTLVRQGVEFLGLDPTFQPAGKLRDWPDLANVHLDSVPVMEIKALCLGFGKKDGERIACATNMKLGHLNPSYKRMT